MKTRIFHSRPLFFGLFSFFFLPSILLAQANDPDKLTITAKAVSDGNEITIRWAPMDYETWAWGNEHGYRLERITTANNGVSLTIDQMAASKVVLDSTLSPIPEAAWETMADSNDMAGVAASTIYGDSLEVENLEEGDFVTIYNTNKQRENQYGYSLFAADHGIDIAEAMGLAYVDVTAEAGKEYFYSVSLNNIPAATTISKGAVKIETDAVYAAPAPIGIEAFPNDSVAIIAWEPVADHYTSYLIDRSSDNGQTWQTVNDKPFVFTSVDGSVPNTMRFADSLAQNNSLYIYRVRGCSPFGLIGPPSDTVHVYGKADPIIAVPTVSDVEELTTGVLTVSWDFPSEYEGKIQGFEIYRSTEVEGDYDKISTSLLGASTRSYVDNNPDPINYYKVIAIDENGYERTSFTRMGQPNDDTPPSAPASLTGNSNSSGVVTLKWTPSPEADVKGYRVYISNQQAGNYTQITGPWINDTVYHYGLNLKTLSEEVYFKVKAIDFRENQSAFSPVATVQRPDIIPPGAPNITKVTAEPNKVHFEWEQSSSHDVVQYKFQRKPHGTPGWVTLVTFTKQNLITTFTDSTASIRRYWDYRLLAIDDVGLIASSDVIKAKPVDNGIRAEILGFTGNYTATDVGVALGWNYPKDVDLMGFEIFRAFDNNEKRSFKFITVDEAKVGIIPGKGYGYADSDLDFTVPVQTSYSANNLDYTTTVVTGGSVSVNGGVTTITPSTVNTPANPQLSVTIRYWVVAKYFDGAMSPLSTEVVIQL